MTRKEALIELRDKVTAGNWLERRLTGLSQSDLSEHASEFIRAYHGSLDAAKALQDAMLPKCVWSIRRSYFGYEVWLINDDINSHGCDNNPARAWLIAILEALIAQED